MPNEPKSQFDIDDDDDFSETPSFTQPKSNKTKHIPLNPINTHFRPSKKPKPSSFPGKENNNNNHPVVPLLSDIRPEGSGSLQLNVSISNNTVSTSHQPCIKKPEPHSTNCTKTDNCADPQLSDIGSQGFDSVQINPSNTINTSHRLCGKPESQAIENATPDKDGIPWLPGDDFEGLDSIQPSLIVDSAKSRNGGYLCNSIESRLLMTKSSRLLDCDGDGVDENEGFEELDSLLELCSEEGLGNDDDDGNGGDSLICCPLCGDDLSSLGVEERQVHTNDCLDKGDQTLLRDNGDKDSVVIDRTVDGSCHNSSGNVVDTSPVTELLRSLGLEKYEETFIREEIDWDSLQWLTEEDIFSMGITALGPRKKLMHALDGFRKERIYRAEAPSRARPAVQKKDRSAHGGEIHSNAPEAMTNESCRSTANKLITDYFPGFPAQRTKVRTNSREEQRNEKSHQNSGSRRNVAKRNVKNGKVRDIPQWCCIPGTPFRVDAFRYLRNDCSHWFLTHFHMDHYQGLTRSFYHGKIYCSLITAKLVNVKIGIPWDRLEVLPLNQKIHIAGTDVTCLDANHCPGSIIILFEPPNGKAVLHTGDFRFNEEMEKMSVLQAGRIHTLILDTTYCNPQYDFPKQEAVIQFVIEAIQAETFNPKTLFLIGSYTIGKERLFLEVARALRKKVYLGVAKLRLLECFGYSKEDMQWFTTNEQESQIHVVPMWTLASFKRLKQIANQYMSRFSLVVAFSPTGWTFGKGKKKSPGRMWRQGTMIRYEVPYSEHSSFTELQQFVKLISPVDIIPSVNNDGPDSANAMISLLLS